MLGISPPIIEQLASPETCGESVCTWKSQQGHTFALVRNAEGFAAACQAGTAIIAAVDAPADYAQRCQPALLIDASEVAARGGGLIYETHTGVRVTRARPDTVQRAWTPQRSAVETDQE